MMSMSLIHTAMWLLITSCLVACMNVGELPPQAQDDLTPLVQTEKIGTVLATQAMSDRRAAHTATRLPNGDVFIAGGLGTVRFFATATSLADGGVLMAGGYGSNISAASQAWVYVP